MVTVRQMIGTDDWASNQRPYSWRAGIFELFPNGSAPITALSSKMQTESVPDPRFYWWVRGFPEQAGTLTGLFTDALMANAYAAGAVAGTTLYAQVPASVAGEFKEGSVIMLRDTDDLDADVIAIVREVVINGANSRLTCYLRSADVGGAHPLTGADRVVGSGCSYPEGSEIPDAIYYLPEEIYSFTQIFQDSLEITGTAEGTPLRTGDSYQDQKRKAYQLHMLNMEKAFLRGTRDKFTGSNGKPQRLTWGLVPFTQLYAAANCDNYVTTTKIAGGTTWLNGGWTWLNQMIELIFRNRADDSMGNTRRFVLCGSGVILGLQRLAENVGQLQLQTGQKRFGLKVTTVQTAFGDLDFYTHPLMTQEVSERNRAIIWVPQNCRYRPKKGRDTKFRPDKSETIGGHASIDGKVECYLTEAGIEWHYPEMCGVLDGFNQDHAP